MEKPSFDKLSPKERARVSRMLSRMEGEAEFEVEETPDLFVITRKNEKGEEVRTSFTKVGDKIPVSDSNYHLADVMEAKLRFPEEDMTKALEMLEVLRAEGRVE